MRTSSLAHFRIIAPLGEGGMGEVYEAEDTRLGRRVAIKVLRGGTSDPERLARFEREARLLAGLGHPRIAAIYEIGEQDGVRFLAMELVAGETLARRLAGGALAPEEAMALALQVAEALEAAHERGVVHRDLKPANVMVDAEGGVKVLDFGVAKALGDESAASELADAPTLTQATAEGAVLGTAAYMSPEQARGRAVDRRTDIWSFGVLLWEMLAGRSPFARATRADTIAAVLGEDADPSALPASTPPGLRRLLALCLRRDPKRRLQHIGDARVLLEEVAARADGGDEAPPATAARPRERALAGLAAASLAVGALAAAVGLLGLRPSARPDAVPVPVRHLDLVLGFEMPESGDFGLSRDGRRIALRGAAPELLVRDLDAARSAPLAGTAWGLQPALSPDGSQVAYVEGFHLYRVAVEGGVPVALAATDSFPHGIHWGEDGFIYVSRSFGESWTPTLFRIAESGGDWQRLEVPPAPDGWIAASWPQALPGGRAILFTRSRGSLGEPAPAGSRAEVLSLEDGSSRVVLEEVARARYAASGHVVGIAADDRLLATVFDLATLRGSGSPVAALDAVAAPYDLAADGTLVYAPAHRAPRHRNSLWQVERDGTRRPLELPPDRYFTVRLSPDGRRVAVLRGEREGSNLWIHDPERGAFSPLTRGPHLLFYSVWSPDGRRIAFSRSAAAGEPAGIFLVEADGSGEPRRLTRGILERPHSFTADGRALAYSQDPKFSGRGGGGGEDLWLLPLDRPDEPRPLLAGDLMTLRPVFSPDGRWLAYVANPTGRPELFVRPADGGGSPVQVSTEGVTGLGAWRAAPVAGEPAWRADGGELYFVQGDRMMAAPVRGERQPQVGAAEELFRFGAPIAGQFAVSADGSRFLVIELDPGEPVTHLKVVQGFDRVLRSKGG